MIARLAGTLAAKSSDAVIVDVGGVGYEVVCPLGTFAALPAVGEPVSLFIVTQIRDDAIRLFGFIAEQDRMLFQKLVSVTGVGPKLAIAVLSGAGTPDLVTAIRSGDGDMLRRIPGVGKKTAERIALELKGSLDDFIAAAGSGPRPALRKGEALDEAVLALISLGYRRNEAERVLADVARARPDGQTEELVRAALRELGRPVSR